MDCIFWSRKTKNTQIHSQRTYLELWISNLHITHDQSTHTYMYCCCSAFDTFKQYNYLHLLSVCPRYHHLPSTCTCIYAKRNSPTLILKIVIQRNEDVSWSSDTDRNIVNVQTTFPFNSFGIRYLIIILIIMKNDNWINYLPVYCSDQRKASSSQNVMYVAADNLFWQPKNTGSKRGSVKEKPIKKLTDFTIQFIYS